MISGVKAVVADMLNLEFEDNSFDVVIEKGTMVRLLFRNLCFPIFFTEIAFNFFSNLIEKLYVDFER
jgi:ubiquinone/menaquinone biosynthesis C-methylase UbiE